MNINTACDIPAQLSSDSVRNFYLRAGRSHEVYGSGKYSFAAHICGQTHGTVVWVAERRLGDYLNPDGLAPFCDPARFIFTYGKTHLDVLWIAEEALRSGIAPIVVVQLQSSIDLTAGRRLQLAAEAGGGIGLFLIPEGAGSNAAETRWACSSICGPWKGLDDGAHNSSNEDSTLFNWQCIKNKSGTRTHWMASWHGATHHMHMVEQAGQPKVVATQPL